MMMGGREGKGREGSRGYQRRDSCFVHVSLTVDFLSISLRKSERSIVNVIGVVEVMYVCMYGHCQ